MPLDHSPVLLGITSKWFNDPASSDLEVRLKNDKVLHCHRLVLCSWSEVWAAALEDKKETSLDLTAHDQAIVEMCVRYCYTATIDIDIDTDDDDDDDNFLTLTRLHLFAHQYDLKELVISCEHRLTQLVTTGLTAWNCTVIYCYLLEHEFPNLPNALQSVKTFMYEEFVAVSESNGFLRLPEKVLCQLLKEDGLLVATEDVLDACCRWLAGSPKIKTAGNDDPQVKRADRVLQLVRFPMLSAKKLLNFKSHPMVSQSENLILRYNFALEWVMLQQAPKRDQERLRIKLREENKTEILTPRISPIPLSIRSQILDEELRKTLASMIGGPRTARLLVDSSSGVTRAVFAGAVRGQGSFLTIIKSSTGHVFGAYVEDTFGSGSGWIRGSPNNFLFSLKAIAPQQVVKLKRSTVGSGIHTEGYGLRMGNRGGLIAFNSHRTADDPAFELAPGYEAVGSKTLHGQFGDYTPVLMEVFALSSPVRKGVK